MTRDDPKINVRLPDAVKTYIHEHAKTNRRTLNAQVVFMLEEYIRHRPWPHKVKLIASKET